MNTLCQCVFRALTEHNAEHTTEHTHNVRVFTPPPLNKSRPFGLHAREGGQGRLLPRPTTPRGAAPLQKKLQKAGYKAKAEKWDTDSDSNSSPTRRISSSK